MIFAPRNLKVYICSHVFSDTRPILLVARGQGDWMFLCGGSDHDKGDCTVVGVGHLVDRDPTLHDCADLPDNFEAERSAVGEPWLRCRIERNPADRTGRLRSRSRRSEWRRVLAR